MRRKYRSKNLDHLGIVSQICDEIGIVEAIDKMIPKDPSMKLSHGVGKLQGATVSRTRFSFSQRTRLHDPLCIFEK